jgi:type II secretory pathway component GspD/PulD (secretin)
VFAKTFWGTVLIGVAIAISSVGAPTAFAQGPSRPAENQLITLESDTTPVVTVLEILAERTGLNIVTSPEVQGRDISIRLKNTPFSEALNLVVRAAGLGYERVGNSILVTDPRNLETETGLTTRVFTLEYANSAEVTAALDIFSENIRSYVSGNRIIVKAPQSVIEEIDGIIREIDLKPAQVMFEARLVEVNTSALKELGVDWERITNWTTILVEGKPPGSIGGGEGGEGITQPGVSDTDQLPDQLGYFKVGSGDAIYRQAAAVEVAIDLLITEGNARLLADSKITTMDNQPAEIFIGETVPVVISTVESGQSAGTFSSTSLEYIETGVKLNIIPRISSEGFITTVVSPEVSNIVAFVGANNDLPATSTRRATSVVRVRDGQKFYLGGLLNESEIETVKKVPILGDIPLIRYLFRHYRTEVKQTDLLIEITPTIVHDQG